MEQKAVELLMQEFEEAVAAHEQPFDGSGDWRSRVNEASTRMVVIAREIAAGGDPAVARFATLMTRGDGHLSLRAAHHLLDFMEPDPASRDAAMSLIQKTAAGSSPEAAAEKLWIESWRDEKQDE